jgi:antitoxin (DNA-binding transcriptional repressor) of toxin-antitoxin stability system
MEVSITEAQDRMDELIAVAEAGGDVVITRDRVPVAKLTPFRQPRKAGWLTGYVETDPSVWDPMTDE